MRDIKEAIKKVYGCLQDEESKFIFENRLLYSFTDDHKYIWRIVKTIPAKCGLDKALAFCREHSEEVAFYGAGTDLNILSKLYPDFPFRIICDSSIKKQQNGWNGIPIISPENLLKNKNASYIAVNSRMYHKEIISFLRNKGIEDERIINLGGIMEDFCHSQYFDMDIVKPKANEIFVDGGCFNCLTDKFFMKWCNGNYDKIYAFEPDAENYEQCQKESLDIENIILYNKGLWNCEAELSFQENGDAGSKIGEGTTVITTTSIDNVVGNDTVSFIKMDIEGAEWEALRGAEHTIRKNHPKLAICVYHKPQDIIAIPEYILSLNGDYRLYFRHYSMNQCETVLYAI